MVDSDEDDEEQINDGEEIRCKLKIMEEHFYDVKELWMLSGKYRRSMLPETGKNIAKFMDAWPNYKCSFGFKLVSRSFYTFDFHLPPNFCLQLATLKIMSLSIIEY